MKKLLKVLLLFFLLLALILAGLGLRWYLGDSRPGLETAEAGSERLTTLGPVRGFAAGPAAHGWLGIPYAAPPVGPLRWRAPRPATPWTTTLEALDPGPVCPQLGGPLAGAAPRDWGRVIGSEDCLRLNVWAPRHTPAELASLPAPYPVMVWIHGGGNTIGYGADYDGRVLAASGQVIVVTINYRLGVLGWFNHPAVLAGAESAADASGNFGTLDTIAALHWVQENIAAFGGDPDRVTIFGESAGGVNVFALLAAEPAKGLFHRAISQSGMAMGVSRERALALQRDGGHPASARELAARWLTEQGKAPDLPAAQTQQGAMAPESLRDFLHSLDPEALIGGFNAPGGMYSAPAVIEDGYVLPARPLLETLGDPASGSTVPLIAGSNRDEAKLFIAMDPAYVGLRWGIKPSPRDPALYEAVDALLSDHWRFLGVHEPLDAHMAAGGEGFAYRFDWDETGSNALLDMPTLLGAAHGFELPFVFGNFDDLWGIPLLFTEDAAPAREALSGAIMSYWAHFAREGRPADGGRGLPAWPAATALAPGRVQILDTTADGGIRTEEQRVTLEALEARMVTIAPGLAGQTACALYAYLFWETSVWAQDRYEALDPICAERSPAVLAADPLAQQ